AVWRNDHLWVTNTITPLAGDPDAGQATAHFFDIDTTNVANLKLTQQGNIGGEDIQAGAYTYDASVMLDSSGDPAFGFALSGSNTYAGAYYTVHRTTDTLGSVDTTAVLSAGTDFYIRNFGTGVNRWGDYSSIAIDPNGEQTYWLFNENAM